MQSRALLLLLDLFWSQHKTKLEFSKKDKKDIDRQAKMVNWLFVGLLCVQDYYSLVFSSSWVSPNFEKASLKRNSHVLPVAGSVISQDVSRCVWQAPANFGRKPRENICGPDRGPEQIANQISVRLPGLKCDVRLHGRIFHAGMPQKLKFWDLNHSI